MKTTINLSDLVMLQMMGYLEDYTQALESGNNPQEVIESVRKRASTPKVFEEIVKKSIKAQFGETYTIVRELAQNGKDAYDLEDALKRVEFTTELSDDNFVLTARDYGCGMTTFEMIKDLLIPYNSGKDKDQEKIGEHGIGWYGIMDLADVVEVISGRERSTTIATVSRVNRVWQATIETLSDSFEGTEVRAYAPTSKANVSAVRDQLVKNVGFCDSKKVQITLNGTQINTLDRDYSLGGQVSVQYKGTQDTLDFFFRRNGNYKKKLPLTQDGLYIKEEDIPFAERLLHNDFMNALMEEGFSFWIDLPTNVGLTKGRNNVVARDRKQVYGAMLPAFEQLVLDVILEDDELVRKLDYKISDWVRNIFDNTYGIEAEKEDPMPQSSEKQMVVQVVRGNERRKADDLEQKVSGADSKSDNPDVQVVVYGEDHFKDLKRPETTSEREKKLEEVTKEYYDAISDFSQKLFEKQFISAQKYSNGEVSYIKISVNDIIKAYATNLLFDLSWHSGEKKDGIYVDGSSHIVSTVLYRLDNLRDGRKKQKEERLVALRSTPAASDERTADSPSIDEVISERSTRRPTRAEKETTVIEIINRTNLKTIDRVVEEEGIGQEYQAFLEVANYIDEVVSKANNLYGSPVMMHYNKRMVFNVEIAHTDRKGISFNFAGRTAYSFVEMIRSGSLDLDTMMKLVDVLVHEKAHCKRSEYDATPEHGRRFYEEDKKQLRENVIAFCFRNKIDPLKATNEMLGKYSFGRVTNPKTFGDLIEKYSSPEYVTVSTKS